MKSRLFFLIPVVLGLGAIVAGWFFSGEARRSQSWPSVEGKVTSSRVVSKQSNGKTRYRPVIRYRYSVNNQSHTGRRLSVFPKESMTKIGAEGDRRPYLFGSKVTVYYDPDDPGKSVLEPGGSWMGWLVYGVGGLFVLIGVLGLLGIAKIQTPE